MGPSVGWNSLLIELFWPKLCSHGSRKGWIRLWASELNRHFRTEADLFDFQCVLSKFDETLGCRKSIEELNSRDEKKLHFLKTKHILEKIRNNWQIIGWRLLARRPKGLSIDDSEITLFRLLVFFFFSQIPLCNLSLQDYCSVFSSVASISACRFIILWSGVNRGMQIRRSVVFLGPIRRSDLNFVQIRIRVTLKIFRGI